jgi:CDP-diacylglycerol--glycerol-3-phosphate 3-phosphatidyltransferase
MGRMKSVMSVVAVVRRLIRGWIKRYAVWLNDVTGGRLRPDDVTIAGFLLHFVVAYFIIIDDFVPAAILLVIFGLFDTLDGELARLQGRASVRGALLDATTDRLKEVILYSAAAVVLLNSHPLAAAWCVAACGISLCVSYVKAKGEAALAARTEISHHKLNYIFQDGFMAFEVRMTILAAGLLFNLLFLAVVIIALGSLLTLTKRFRRIARELS